MNSRPPALTIGRIKQAEFRYRRWSVIMEDGWPFENALKPEFWAQVASQLTPGDTIEVDAEDLSWTATLRVLSCGRSFAKVAVVAEKTILQSPHTDPVDDEPCKIEWRGPSTKWRVVRLSDMKVLKEGFADRDAAELYARDYRKTMAA